MINESIEAFYNVSFARAPKPLLAGAFVIFVAVLLSFVVFKGLRG